MSRQLRRNSPVLTYNGFQTIISGSSASPKRRYDADRIVLYRSLVFATFLFAACLYVSLDPNSQTHLGNRRKVEQLLGNIRRRRLASDQIQLRYNAPDPQEYQRTVWTLDTFPVNGVNLARYGFENEHAHHKQRRASATMEEEFELFEDFDISSFLEGTNKLSVGGHSHENKRSPAHMLMYQRHSEEPSLAFYMDKIAQKSFLKAIGIPVPLSHLAKYHDEFVTGKDGKQADGDREEEIRKLLPNKSDYVVKSHKSGGVIFVSFVEETNSHIMWTVDSSGKKGEEYSADAVAHQINDVMHPRKNHFLDPWAMAFVQPGVVIEDRFTSFESVDKPPMHLSVYVIWGRVWMATWRDAEGPGHSGLVFRNGTVIMDDMAVVKMPRWAKWDLVMETAEDIAAHKDILQIDFLIGVSAEAAYMLSQATVSRQEKLAEVQIVVSGIKLNPSDKFPNGNKDLLNEMGRLWIAGYEMGIHRLIPNNEVPPEYVQHHRLTTEAAKRLDQTYGLFWKLGSTINAD
ncbi:expressed unknown protein [Seminavis robusta]|uniref:Uncharacterized protein n=1 Tax=Seminavis robusta TaxID=568900 RepID=A0A9N8E575_9STRA|nr:expressed unknown protein [Seminavis robusta]|eukprot:Sro684_g186730.1 n/a (515) ;mRNA; r:14946-16490